MTNIVSYAQCAEDLVLWGALGDVPKGFYIDVGAADPNHESVTRLFYEHGWSGVNIEPRANGFAAFPLARPRDVNLQIAVSNKSGMFTLHEVIDHVYLTTMVDNFAKNYEANGMACRSYEVPCRTLASVCEEHVHSDIHFLKIDVEGAELSALEGCDFKRFRPWLLAVEATLPCSNIPSHAEWEPLILAAGYEFALFHEVNRYYVAREHLDRKSRIVAPAA